MVFDEPFSESDSNELRGLDLHKETAWDRFYELADSYGGRPAIEIDYNEDPNDTTEFGYSHPKGRNPRRCLKSEKGGDPYFRHETITVGGTETPVTLNVNSAARKDWRCEWRIHATYNTEGKNAQSVIIDDDGKPLIAEGIPASPIQEWVVDPHGVRIVNCITHPRDSGYCQYPPF